MRFERQRLFASKSLDVDYKGNQAGSPISYFHPISPGLFAPTSRLAPSLGYP